MTTRTIPFTGRMPLMPPKPHERLLHDVLGIGCRALPWAVAEQPFRAEALKR